MIGFLLRQLSQVPADDGWLTAAERRWFNDRRSAKRIADWRLGRWTAKAAIGAFLERQARPRPVAIEILAAEDGAPGVFTNGRPLPVSLSLSHSHGRAVSVVAETGFALGCDIERIEPRSSAFVTSYFTRSECATLAAADSSGRDLLANLLWSAKESALKALRHGLRADTRAIEVVADRRSGELWGRLEVSSRSGGAVLAGHWTRLACVSRQCPDNFVLTVISRPTAGEIVDLDLPSHRLS